MRILRSTYEDPTAKVRIGGMTSESIVVMKGVRQGGVMSSFYYLVYIDELLNTLELSNLGACVMSTNVGNPSFADDLALVAIVPFKLQKLVDIVYRYCRTWHIDVIVTNSATVVYTSKKANHIQTGIMYGNAFIEQDDHAIHLGIRQDSNLSLNTRIQERCQKARNSLFAMAGQGLHPNGINHAPSVNLYCKIIIPTVL